MIKLRDIESGGAQRTTAVSLAGADRKSAIATGILYIAGTAIGVVGLGIVLAPLLGAQDYLAAYGSMGTRVAWAVLIELAMSVALVGMAATAFPVLSKHSPGAAAAYLAARALEAVPVILGALSMLALSGLGREYLAAGGAMAADASRFEPLAGLLIRIPEWAGHGILDVAIFPIGAMILYATLYRHRLVPRWLSAWGMAGAILYWVAGILVMFGSVAPLETPHIVLQAPLGVQEMVLAGWLIVRGFGPGATKEAPDA